MTPQEFLKTLGPAATQLYQKTGIFASVTLAQAALESGWLKKFPVDKYTGKISYNAFGIKGFGTVGSVTYDSDEVINGQRISVESQFRSYNNYYESMADHHKFLEADKYKPVRNAATPEEASRQLYACGYATDPEYPAKLIRIISQYGLKQYDVKEDKKSMKIYIDKGHGEDGDPGACNDGLIERDMTIITGNALGKRLEEYGWGVVLEQGNLEITESANAANGCGADLCISVHYNAGGGDRGEVIHSWKSGAVELANAVAQGLKKAGQTKLKIIKCKANGKGTAEHFGILRTTKMPAVIVEPCFIDNAADRIIADTMEEQKNIGICIADALAEVYGGSLAKTDAATVAAINAIHTAGVSSSPDYWLENAAPGKQVNGGYVGSLVKKATGKTTVAEAIDALQLSNPAYWLEHAVPGKTADGKFVGYLIQKIAKIL